MGTRRDFLHTAGAGTLGFMMPTLPDFNLKYNTKLDIGYTYITWGYGTEDLEPAMKGMSELGFNAFETFGRVIQDYEEKKDGIGPLLEKYDLPLKSAFCMANVLDKKVIREEGDKLVKWAKLCKKYGGDVMEFSASMNRKKVKGYRYADYKSTIITAFNEYAKRVTDVGITFAFHQHTDTPIELPDEVYSLMNSVNTEYVRFGPDIGQLKKGGGDPVQVLKDFISITEHIHLKDFDGGDYYLGYTPLGMGKVRIKEVLDVLENSDYKGMVMAELDYSKKMPRTPKEAAEISKNYLADFGYRFKS